MRASGSFQRIAVLGDGGWGTTLAIHLHRLGHRVSWWGAFPEYVTQIARRRENPKYLPGIRIPAGLSITSTLSAAIDGAQLLILAVPSQHLRSVAKRLRPARWSDASILSVAKGIEQRSLKRMSEVIHEELGPVHLAVLSGPNIALEIAKGQPASSVVASHNIALAKRIQATLMSERLRMYTSDDVTGVELGGALKNPVAIAAGIGDGLGFGANAKAALVTRGIVEMARLGVAAGAKEQTFWGLSGLGDLVTTCLSGRNRWLGEQIGRGRSLSSIVRSTPMVIEGVETSKAAIALAKRYRVHLPIIEQVHAILFQRRSPQRALQALMRRTGKAES
ncbi:MAG: glycerol-3-phosphate dehydrogenase [Candidatus Omnitrophica bacterium CG11_big_fil_rev_8_21_14_0_20_63_9]|nr:MAG: glycerol-3-phosphate dehydrogenase [Candidatus Omnitrophica bacterium CG11_big_fil_rev_8_21_14_0_20_63_9]